LALCWFVDLFLLVHFVIALSTTDLWSQGIFVTL
jgi:hypothetical protein